MMVMLVGGPANGVTWNIPYAANEVYWPVTAESDKWLVGQMETYACQRIATPDGWLTTCYVHESLPLDQIDEPTMISTIMTTWRAAWKQAAPIDNPRFAAI